MPDNRIKTGQFKKGASGNPGGRPKVPEEFKEIAKKNSIPALHKVIEILQSPDSENKDKLRAAEIIMDRAWGKAKQELEVGNIEDRPFEVTIKVVD
jgi:hypothetical protein